MNDTSELRSIAIRNERRISTAFGLFSIALGLSELVAPKRLAWWLGMRRSARLFQVFGAREIATGIGLLTSANAGSWMGARVAGDMLDIGSLARGLRPGNPRSSNTVLALGIVAAVTLADVIVARLLTSST